MDGVLFCQWMPFVHDQVNGLPTEDVQRVECLGNGAPHEGQVRLSAEQLLRQSRILVFLIPDCRLRVEGPVAGQQVLAAGQGEAVIGGDLQHPVLPQGVDGQLQLLIGVGNLVKMYEKGVSFPGGNHAGSVAVEEGKAQFLLQTAHGFA